MLQYCNPTSCRSHKRTIQQPHQTTQKYHAMAAAACEITWLRQLLQQIKFGDVQDAGLICDNEAAIHIASNLTRILCWSICHWFFCWPNLWTFASFFTGCLFTKMSWVFDSELYIEKVCIENFRMSWLFCCSFFYTTIRNGLKIIWLCKHMLCLYHI